eukprot:5121582-Alexandrium_andersonii.AAC.1
MDGPDEWVQRQGEQEPARRTSLSDPSRHHDACVALALVDNGRHVAGVQLPDSNADILRGLHFVQHEVDPLMEKTRERSCEVS